ncbi:hypothetical protein CR513_04015, partial [Mucuna pruriens]
MAPITTYFLMFISSVFYVFWDARLVLEEFTVQDRLDVRVSMSKINLEMLNGSYKQEVVFVKFTVGAN